MTVSTPSSILLDHLWPRSVGPRALLRTLVLALLGSLLLWASARIQIPFYPVPMTLQTAAVLLVGLVAGSRLGALTVGVYLLEGALGLPVFAGTPERGIGLAYMLGPTGGYLLGFALAAWLAGLAAERGVRGATLLAVLLAANAAIYLPGLLWLSLFVGWDGALAVGLVPFLLGDGLKLLLAWALFLALRRSLMPPAQRHS